MTQPTSSLLSSSVVSTRTPSIPSEGHPTMDHSRRGRTVTPQHAKEHESAVLPNLLSVEMWLLQGGGGRSSSGSDVKKGTVRDVVESSKPRSSPVKVSLVETTKIPTKVPTTSSIPHHRQQQQRGRSQTHIDSPSKQRSSSARHGSSSSSCRAINSSSIASPPPGTELSIATTPTTNPKHIETTTTTASGNDRDNTTTVVPCPIPSIYVSYIRNAFAGGSSNCMTDDSSSNRNTRPINLYTEVLGLSPPNHDHHPSHTYTDTQIRVAYFRQGRLVLQKGGGDGQQLLSSSSLSSSPNSTIIQNHIVDTADKVNASTNIITPKERFQAITKAYEIVTNPHYKAYYEIYGLPPLKPDAPTSTDLPQPRHLRRTTTATSRPTPTTTTSIAGGTPSSTIPQSTRRIDPIMDDRNDQRRNMHPVTIFDYDSTSIRIDHNSRYNEKQGVHEDDIDSVGSHGSILRNSSNKNYNGTESRPQQRSKSWGPVASSSRQRVVWKEVVQELIYQPDPPSNQSIEITEQPEHYTASKEPAMTVNAIHQQELDDRDFLDDIEASVDGIGATINNFVKYLSEQDDVVNHSIEINNDDNDHESVRNHNSEQNQHPVSVESYDDDSSQVVRQLFKELTMKPSTPIETEQFGTIIPSKPSGDGGGAYAKRIAEHHNRRSHSCDTSSRRRERCITSTTSTTTTTTTAPLKEGKIDQEPRIKPKKSKRKKKRGCVDRVPSNMNNFDDGREQTRGEYDDDFVFDPFQNSIDTSSVDFGAVDGMIDAWNTSVTKKDRLTTTKNTVFCNTKFDAYDLPDVSSILASLDGENTTTPPLDLGTEKSLSFDDALDRSTDATTKGYIRLDRRANSLSAITDNDVPTLDVSDITYSSKMSDDPAGRHFHFNFLTSLTQSAKATIKEIASFDEDDDDKVNPGLNNNKCTAKSPSANGATSHISKDDDMFSQINSFMQSFVDDMNKLGTQIGTNLIETNRVVRESMSIPEANVTGFLERIGTELNFSKSVDQTDNELQKSFTY